MTSISQLNTLVLLLLCLPSIALCDFGGQWEMYGTIFGSIFGGLIVIGIIFCIVYVMCLKEISQRPGHRPQQQQERYKMPVTAHYPYPTKDPAQIPVQQQQHYQPQPVPNQSPAQFPSQQGYHMDTTGTTIASFGVPVLEHEPGRFTGSAV